MRGWKQVADNCGQPGLGLKEPGGPDQRRPLQLLDSQCGLSSRILEVLKKGGFDRPLPIQAQALPSERVFPAAVLMLARSCPCQPPDVPQQKFHSCGLQAWLTIDIRCRPSQSS